jgi:transcriptional regulator with XRE-family HTH domain
MTAHDAQLVARRVRALRARQGVSARELAELCDRAGVSSLTRVAIAKLESGRRGVLAGEVAALAQVLGVTTDDLVLEFSDTVVPVVPPGVPFGQPHPSAASSSRSLGTEPTCGRQQAGEPGVRTSSVVDIAAELKTLRKGRGLRGSRLDEKLGPTLRAVCLVGDADTPEDVRRKVTERLEDLAIGLPEDLRIAALAALGTHGDARHPLYRERVLWVAAQLRRDERTARRRIDEAIERLAERSAALHTNADAITRTPADWYTNELRVSLVLDQPAVEAFEQRRIVAQRDNLDQIDLGLAGHAVRQQSGVTTHWVAVDVIYGGTLIGRRETPEDGKVLFSLALPRPLQLNEEHEFSLRFRVLDANSFRPHYVCVPRSRCDVFDLRIRFDKVDSPRRVRRLAEAFHRDVMDPLCGESVTVDPAGEIHLTFHQLRPGLAYGAGWGAAD